LADNTSEDQEQDERIILRLIRIGGKLYSIRKASSGWLWLQWRRTLKSQHEHLMATRVVMTLYHMTHEKD